MAKLHDSEPGKKRKASTPPFEKTPKPNQRGPFSFHHFLYLMVCAMVMLAGVQQISSPKRGISKWLENAGVGGETREPSTVRVVRTETGYQLLFNGEPYFIRGAGAVGAIRLDLMKRMGGNSIRTWAADGLLPMLDEAQEKGITVMIGLWVAHGRHGFDYSNPEMVARQLEEMRQKVRRYKNHPALLLWGVGNEAEGNGEDENFWRALNDIAAMIKVEDPDHPTVTVLAEIGGPKIAMLKRLCPAIDILGVNSYKGLQTLPERLQKAGWTKPYIMTEYGPPGPWSWEVPTTKWGAPIELTSTEKAAYYEKGYNAAVATQSGRCLGSYAFIWGDKQEGTSTWFGLLLPDGSILGSTLSVSKMWTGKDPLEQAPEIIALKSKAFAKEVRQGQAIRVTLQTKHNEKDPLTVRWDLRDEKAAKRPGSDAEFEPNAYSIDVLKESSNELYFRAPKVDGPYRLFVYVVDGHGYVATANMPFYVGKAPVEKTNPAINAPNL